MAVVIRLSRSGKKNSPFYKVLVQDKQRHPQKSFLENLGCFYALNQQNPKDKNFTCDVARLQYWLSRGAQCSPRIKSLLEKNGIDLAGNVVKVLAETNSQPQDIA